MDLGSGIDREGMMGGGCLGGKHPVCTSAVRLPIRPAMVSPLTKPPVATPVPPTAATPPARVPGLPSASQLIGMQVAATVVGIAGGVAACVVAQNTGWEGVAPYLLGAGVAIGTNLLPGLGLLTVQLGRRFSGHS